MMKTYSIKLFCAHGFSSLLLCKVIQSQIDKLHLSYIVNAYSYFSIEEEKDADVILLGPQIANYYHNAKALFPHIPIFVIDMSIYSHMGASQIIHQIQEVL